jgi:hypothetical protein
MREALTAAFFVAILILSGCAGSGSKALPSKASSTTAAPATVTQDTGGIEGVVRGEDTLPISGVEVGLIKGDGSSKTDAGGRFSFSGLVTGAHQLAFQRLGYESASRKVDVVAGEVSHVNVTLVVIAIVEPYPEVLPFEAYFHAVVGPSNFATSAVNVPDCDKCTWFFNVTADTVSLVSEILFKPGVSNPQGDTVYYAIYDKDTKLKGNGFWTSGSKVQIDRPGKWSESRETLHQENACDVWPCVDMKLHGYITLFHVAPPPEDYTALPKA